MVPPTPHTFRATVRERTDVANRIRDKWIARGDLPPQVRLGKMMDEIKKAVREKVKAGLRQTPSPTTRSNPD